MRAMDVDDANIKETVLRPQSAHSFVDFPPANYLCLYFPHHDGSCSCLVCAAAALIDSVAISEHSHRRLFPAHLLQRFDADIASSQCI